MTTKHSFLTKIFEENEISKHNYKNYDFTKFSDDKINLLQKLTIISKYKSLFKSLLLRKKVSDREKFDYLTHNKPSLSYSEYIRFNVMMEDNENSFVQTLYVVGGINIMLFTYFIAKRPPNQPLIKETTFSILFSMMAGYGYYRYKKLFYKNSLNELYETLEKRLNDFPELKKENNNKNFMSEDNYDEFLDEQL